ncbi:MAG: hypothetical protein A2W91_06490 [Bacteroidetes bacterium GWF2_38_335]|nr:MAG: hypothetical protein A2W91_06490 [Bacteroidetes bacterium GWF2_38_335]OFY77681.1 MAG: hypothetical protein A2281_18005 [Bacteroidetes bacterium RIFOXYA12_FULL_38_20]HBS89090.1 hypothetical protein [Bacteroidales bacterium]
MKLLIAAVFLMSLFTGCITLKEVNVGKIEGVKIVDISKESVKVELMMPVENKNNFKIKIKDVDLEVAVNKVNMGKVTKIKKVVIPRNSNETHSFLIEAKLDNVLMGGVSLAGSMFKNKANIKVSGHIKAKAFFVSKKIKIDENNPVKLFKNRD